MKFTVSFVLSSLLLSAVLAPALGTSGANHDHRPDLKGAMKTLEKSRADLMKGEKDFGGHRTKAVQAIDAAIDEIKQAITFEKHRD